MLHLRAAHMKSIVWHPLLWKQTTPHYKNKPQQSLHLCPKPPTLLQDFRKYSPVNPPHLTFPLPSVLWFRKQTEIFWFPECKRTLRSGFYILPLSIFQYLTLCIFHPDFPQDLQLILAGIQVGEKARPSSLWDLTDLGRYLDCSPKAKWYNTYSGKNLVFGLKSKIFKGLPFFYIYD